MNSISGITPYQRSAINAFTKAVFDETEAKASAVYRVVSRLVDGNAQANRERTLHELVATYNGATLEEKEAMATVMASVLPPGKEYCREARALLSNQGIELPTAELDDDEFELVKTPLASLEEARAAFDAAFQEIEQAPVVTKEMIEERDQRWFAFSAEIQSFGTTIDGNAKAVRTYHESQSHLLGAAIPMRKQNSRMETREAG